MNFSLRIQQSIVFLVLGCAGAAGCGSGRTIAGPPPRTVEAVQQVFTRSGALADCHGSSSPQLDQDLSSVERSLASIVNVPSVEVPDPM
jgi:hypothetical protein